MARAKKRDDGRYQVRLTVGRKDGKPIIKYFYSSKSISDARRQRDEWMDTHNFGYDGVPTPAMDGGMTVDAWVEKWLTSYKGQMEANTRDFYYYKAQAFQNFKREGIRYGDMAISAIMPIHLTEYLNSLSGKSKSTIRSAKMTIQQIFDTARMNGLIPRDVCADLIDTVKSMRLKGTYEGHDALPRDTIDLICQNYHRHRAGLLVMICMFSGLRPGEAAGLQWEDVDMKNNILHVRQARDLKHAADKSTKTETGVRDVPIFAPLKRALQRNRDMTGYLCTRADGKPHSKESAEQAFDSFRYFLERIVNNVPNPEQAQGFRKDKFIAALQEQKKEWIAVDFTMYDLRVTFCTTLYDAGVDLKTAQKLMGHKDATTTLRIYTKLSEQRKVDSTDKMEQFLAATYGA